MERTRIILLIILAAITYGIIHDEITVRICIEYFTVAHPPLFHTQSPTLLAFCWGILATVGIGAVMGAILADAAQSGDMPPYPMPRLDRSLFILFATMAISASLAGFLGFQLARHSILSLPASFASVIAPERRDRFMAVWFAHCASYLVGLAGGTILILRIWRQRGKPRILAIFPRTTPAILRALFLIILVFVILYIRFAHSQE